MINPDNSIHIVAKITPKPEFFEQGLAALAGDDRSGILRFGGHGRGDQTE